MWSKVGQSALVTSTSASNLTVAPPSSYAAGDLLCLVAAGTGTGIGAATNGYALRYEGTSTAGNLSLFTKIAGTTEGNTTVTNTSTAAQAIIFAFREIEQGTIEAGPTSPKAGSGATVPCGTLTTLTGNDLVLLCAISRNGLGTWSTNSSGNLSSVTEILDSQLAKYINYVKNPSFEGDDNSDGLANSWVIDTSGINGTITKTLTATNAVFGSNAQRIEYTTVSGDSGAVISLTAADSTVAGEAAEGNYWTASCYLRGVATGCSVRIRIRWYKADGSQITTSSSVQTINNTSMDRYSHTAGPAPAETSKTTMSIVVDTLDYSGADSIDLYCDGAQLEKGNSVNNFLAGTARKNWVRNPSFEGTEQSNGLGDNWTASATNSGTLGNCTFDVQTMYKYYGSYGQQIACTGTASPNESNHVLGVYADLTGSGTTGQGDEWTASCYVRGTLSGVPAFMGIRWYDSLNAYVTRSKVEITSSISTPAFTRVDYTVQVPTAYPQISQAQFYIGFEEIDYGDSFTVQIDNVLLERTDTLGTYFDGSTTGYAWEGSAHDSFSVTASSSSTTSIWSGSENNSRSSMDGVSLAVYTGTQVSPGSTGAPSLTQSKSIEYNAFSIAFKAKGEPEGEGVGVFGWNGSSFASQAVDAYTSSTVKKSSGVYGWTGTKWFEIIPTGTTEWPTTYYNAVTDGGCHNDGSTDDLAHLQAAATNALNEGKALYLPSGTGYKLSSYWTVPAGLQVFGDDDWTDEVTPSSRVLGQIRVNNNTLFKDLYIGVTGDTAMHPSSSSTLIQNVHHERCRFRGGNSGSDGTCYTIGGGYYKLKDFTWKNCGFEAPNAVYTAGGVAHALQFSTDPRLNSPYGLIANHVIEGCYFGLPNSSGDECTNYGWIIYYQNANFYEYGNPPGSTPGYHDNIYIRNNFFGYSQQWGIDFANQDTDNSFNLYPTDYEHLKMFVEGNIFYGAGKDWEKTGHYTGDPPVWVRDYQYNVPVTFECGFNGTISNNIFYRSRALGSGHINPTKKCYGLKIENNTFEFRYDNGIIPAYHGEDGEDRMYRKVIRSEGLRNSIIRNNKLMLPNTLDGVTYTNKGTNQAWVYLGSNPTGNTVEGNTTSWGGTAIDYDNDFDW